MKNSNAEQDPPVDESHIGKISQLTGGAIATATNSAAAICRSTVDLTSRAGQAAYSKLPEVSQIKQMATATGDAAASMCSSVAETAGRVGQQAYSKMPEVPQIRQVVEATNGAIGYAGSVCYSAAASAYNKMPEMPPIGQTVGLTSAIIGTAASTQLWAGAAASTVGRKALRAGCISSSMKVFNMLHLPNALRATAVWTGVNVNNYIVSGFIPGLFTAWAIYDTVRVAQWAYKQYNPQTGVLAIESPQSSGVVLKSSL